MVYSFGDVQIDCTTFEIRMRNVMVAVEPKVYDVLLYLVRNHHRVVTKAELLSNVWPGTLVGESALTRCVSIARTVIGKDVCIKSLYKRGYRFIGSVVEVSSAGSGEPLQDAALADRLTTFRSEPPQIIGKR
jgi:DNA-binding winged helix-turn-helix (wHTH) protein